MAGQPGGGHYSGPTITEYLHDILAALEDLRAVLTGIRDGSPGIRCTGRPDCTCGHGYHQPYPPAKDGF